LLCCRLPSFRLSAFPLPYFVGRLRAFCHTPHLKIPVFPGCQTSPDYQFSLGSDYHNLGQRSGVEPA